MNKYIVKFYYNTDFRFDWKGLASNELAALAFALFEHKLIEWSCSEGFRIEIHAA